jgi:hypothetical protein
MSLNKSVFHSNKCDNVDQKNSQLMNVTFVTALSQHCNSLSHIPSNAIQL